MGLFDFINKKNLHKGEAVNLLERYRVNERQAYDGVPTIYYDILSHDNKKLGTIELRLTVDGINYYYGHIGYDIMQEHRGHHYAYEACRELFKIAKEEFNMNELIITCSPENIASYKTLVKLNGVLVETVDVPKGHLLYTMGEKVKHVFKYNI